MTVGTHDVTGMKRAAVGADGGSFDSLHYRLPMEADTEFYGPVEQELVEEQAFDAATVGRRERRLGDGGCSAGIGSSVEADAGEDGADGGRDVDAEFSEGREGVGHEAFTAGLVDGRSHAVGDLDTDSSEGGGDSAGKTCWAGACDEEVGLRWGSARVHEKGVLCRVRP